MNRLLARDREFFDFEFPEARSFLNAAHLRHQAFSLLNQWEKDRLMALMETPACNTQWFEKLINKGRSR